MTAESLQDPLVEPAAARPVTSTDRLGLRSGASQTNATSPAGAHLPPFMLELQRGYARALRRQDSLQSPKFQRGPKWQELSSSKQKCAERSKPSVQSLQLERIEGWMQNCTLFSRYVGPEISLNPRTARIEIPSSSPSWRALTLLKETHSSQNRRLACIPWPACCLLPQKASEEQRLCRSATLAQSE